MLNILTDGDKRRRHRSQRALRRQAPDDGGRVQELADEIRREQGRAAEQEGAPPRDSELRRVVQRLEEQPRNDGSGFRWEWVYRRRRD